MCGEPFARGGGSRSVSALLSAAADAATRSSPGASAASTRLWSWSMSDGGRKEVRTKAERVAVPLSSSPYSTRSQSRKSL